jgi:hypothetical protein
VNQACSDGMTPLCIAVQNGHVKVVTDLLGEEAAVNQARDNERDDSYNDRRSARSPLGRIDSALSGSRGESSFSQQVYSSLCRSSSRSSWGHEGAC